MANTKRQLSEVEREQRRAQDRERLRAAAEQLLSSEGWRRWVRTRSSNGLARYSLTNQLLVGCSRRAARRSSPGSSSGLSSGTASSAARERSGSWRRCPSRPRDRHSGEETGETITLFKAVAVFFQEQVEALPCGEPTPLEAPREPLTGDSHAHLLGRLVASASRSDTRWRSSRSRGRPAAGVTGRPGGSLSTPLWPPTRSCARSRTRPRTRSVSTISSTRASRPRCWRTRSASWSARASAVGRRRVDRVCRRLGRGRCA